MCLFKALKQLFLKELANVKEQKISWSHQLSLEELGNVEERREEDDRQDVARHPGHRARRGRVVSETYFFTFFSFKVGFANCWK